LRAMRAGKAAGQGEGTFGFLSLFRLTESESHAEAEPELSGRRVSEPVDRCSERRSLREVHALDRRRGQRIERGHRGREDRRQDGLVLRPTINGRQLEVAAVGEYRVAAPTEVLLIEDVQDLRLDEEIHSTRTDADAVVVVDGKIGPAESVSPERI